MLDGGGILLSGLCMLHCLLLPVTLTLLPILGSTWLADESFHFWMLGLIIPTSGLALIIGCRRHRDGVVAWAGTAGLLLLVVTAVIGELTLSESIERWPTLAGGLSLTYAHWRNFRRCQALHCEARTESATLC